MRRKLLALLKEKSLSQSVATETGNVSNVYSFHVSLGVLNEDYLVP